MEKAAELQYPLCKVLECIWGSDVGIWLLQVQKWHLSNVVKGKCLLEHMISSMTTGSEIKLVCDHIATGQFAFHDRCRLQTTWSWELFLRSAGFERERMQLFQLFRSKFPVVFSSTHFWCTREDGMVSEPRVCVAYVGPLILKSRLASVGSLVISFLVGEQHKAYFNVVIHN